MAPIFKFTRKSVMYAGLLIFTFSACQSGKSGKSQTKNNASDTSASQMALKPAWRTDTVLKGSESALFDSAREQIYVTCGNTDPVAKDGDGFIAILTPRGKIKKLNWLDGLDAPKGMALMGNRLYVTDIDQIRVINVETASIETSVPVDGAQFLNDVCTDGTRIFFSDSKAGKIYAMQPDGLPEIVVESAPGVNGLEIRDGKLFSLQENGLNLYNVPEFSPALMDSTIRGGDGLIILDDSTFIASRWEGEIFSIQGKHTYQLIDTREKSNTADIGWMGKDRLVLVPTFFQNELVAYTLRMQK